MKTELHPPRFRYTAVVQKEESSFRFFKCLHQGCVPNAVLQRDFFEKGVYGIEARWKILIVFLNLLCNCVVKYSDTRVLCLLNYYMLPHRKTHHRKKLF